MKLLPFGVALIAVMTTAAPSQAYKTLTVDYQICTAGAGKVANQRIVDACTRLIKNASKKNELVGFFHALRATSNTNKQLNCQDAKTAFQLLSDPDHKKLARQLEQANC